MVGLIVVAVGCFAAGSFGVYWWLPELAPSPSGRIAFVSVCGLVGAATALVGITVDGVVRELQKSEYGHIGRFEVAIVSSGLIDILRDAGTLVALALIAYLLAPKPQARAVASQPTAG